jgi:hypothetical protein
MDRVDAGRHFALVAQRSTNRPAGRMFLLRSLEIAHVIAGLSSRRQIEAGRQ